MEVGHGIAFEMHQTQAHVRTAHVMQALRTHARRKLQGRMSRGVAPQRAIGHVSAAR